MARSRGSSPKSPKQNKAKKGPPPHPPRFVPPPLPKCAVIPEKFQVWQKEAQQRRRKMQVEEVEALDFHGFGGTIAGLRAYLAHKYGGSARGWRRDVAPDEEGLKPATWIEFCLGMKRCGYAGQAKTVWKELSKNTQGVSASLEDLEPDLAEQLDALCDSWADEYQSGGAYEAWPVFRHEHASRVNYDEFVEFFSENYYMIPDSPRVDFRRIFDALDMKGQGSITREDLRFFDHWAHRRLGKPLPKEPVVVKAEEEHWKPPPKKAAKVYRADDLRDHLGANFGTPARAWRMLLDPQGHGTLTANEFGAGCRQAGFVHPHMPIWRELKEEGGGAVSLRVLDPKSMKAIDAFNDKLRLKFGYPDAYAFWAEKIDPAGTCAVNLTEFVADVSKELGITKDQAARVFKCLDVQDSGWVSVTEIGFLELCRQQKKAEQQSQPSTAMTSVFSDTSQPPESEYAPHRSLKTLSQLIDRTAYWDDTADLDNKNKRQKEQQQSRRSQTAVTLGSVTRVPSEPALPVWRSTASRQRAAYFASHTSKHRWLTHAALDRLQRSASEVPLTKLAPMTPERDIFRTTNEFYREGVKLWKQQRNFQGSLTTDGSYFAR